MTNRNFNILLITSDQQRYDTLGVNGNPLIRTPHLDCLAREGTNFQQAFVTNPICIPSRACLQTGRYPHQHGVEHMEFVVDETPGLPAWEVTFMERLQVSGYRTGAFGKMHMYPPKGFHEQKLSGGQGARWDRSSGSKLGPGPLGNEYAVWLEERHPGGYEAIYEQRRQPEYRQHGSAVQSVLPVEEYVDTWVAENTMDFIRHHANEEQPFFAWCGFLNPHTPLDAPAPYDQMYDPDTMPIPTTFLADVSDRPDFYAKRQNGFRNNPDKAKLRRMIAHYYGLCTMLDDLCGRIFDTLKAERLWDNTLIIYMSDHGDLMGDFGMSGKGNFLDGSIHVPLIVKAPADPRLDGVRSESNTKAKRAESVVGLVEHFDVAATILDYAGVAKPTSMSAESLRPLVEGNGAGKAQVLCEFTENDRSYKGKCLRTTRYKYILWTPGRMEELYDMQVDPLEERNLIDQPDYQEIAVEMRRRMIEQLMITEKPLMTPLSA